MEILHLGKYYPPEPGGMEAVVKSFAEATGGKLRNYCLVATKTGSTRIEPADRQTVHYLKERGTFLLSPVLPSLPAVLARLRREGRFSAILLHYPNPTAVLALFLSLLALPKREKIVLWHHADVLLDEWWKKALFALYRPVERFIFRRTDAFIAATPHHIASSPVLSRYREKTSIIPFAVPDEYFDISAEEKEQARNVVEGMGGRFVLFVGRLVPYKGLDTLLRAAKSISGRIAVIGTGPLEAKIRKDVAAFGLDEKVRLLGKVENLRPYYHACEFLVLPSNSALEAFGIVQIEAMALGKPVVSSDLPTGVTWVNRHGETGLTFPVGDSRAFADACNRLLSDTGYKARLGEHARARTLREFSYTAMGEKGSRFFERLCGGAG